MVPLQLISHENTDYFIYIKPHIDVNSLSHGERLIIIRKVSKVVQYTQPYTRINLRQEKRVIKLHSSHRKGE
jgi:hypothetical protein